MVIKRIGVLTKMSEGKYQTKMKIKMSGLDGKAIEKLKKYFAKQDDVLMAFVFGSHAKGISRLSSDWDIAVYFKPQSCRIEWEERGCDYPQEDKLWNDLIDILKTDSLDLIILNRAPVSLAEAAIRGIPLIIKDRSLFLKFMLIVSQEAEDYRQFVNESFLIAERSLSLVPQDRQNLQRIISFLNEEISLYSYYQKITYRAYEGDVHKRNDIERWIEKIINAIIDSAKIILSSQKKAIPETYRDALIQAVILMDLPEDFIEKFERWVKLRNILAHEYLEMRWKRIADFVENSQDYFAQFISAVKNFLKS